MDLSAGPQSTHGKGSLAGSVRSRTDQLVHMYFITVNLSSPWRGKGASPWQGPARWALRAPVPGLKKLAVPIFRALLLVRILAAGQDRCGSGSSLRVGPASAGGAVACKGSTVPLCPLCRVSHHDISGVVHDRRQFYLTRTVDHEQAEPGRFLEFLVPCSAAPCASPAPRRK